MKWSVTLKESVIDDLRWFGRKTGRILLAEAERQLSKNPVSESKNLKTLKPNRIAQREFRLFGKYRVLFNVDHDACEVTIINVGEKRGNALFVQGVEFREHNEGDPVE